MTTDNYHSHRHHHHHHRKSKQKKIVNGAIAVLFVVVFLLLVTVIFSPNRLRRLVKGTEDVIEREYQRGNPANQGNYDGIDISHHQGRIDWQTVARDTSIQFVYIKATEGSTHQDRHYQRNFECAKKAGFLVGSYHFYSSSSSATSQVENFLRTVDVSRQDILPVIDVEWSGTRGMTAEEISDSLDIYVQLIKKHFGTYPMIYADATFYNRHLSPHFDQLPLFIARYSNNSPGVKNVRRQIIWQWNSHGLIDGIPAEVDLDAFAKNKSVADILLPKRPPSGY